MFDFLEIEEPVNQKFLSSLNPILKLEFLILIYVLTFKFNNIILNSIILVLLMIIVVFNKPNYKILGKGLLLALYLFIFYAIFILFFISDPNEGLNLFIVHISLENIIVLLNIFIRVILLALSTITYIMYTGVQYIIYSFEDILYPLTYLKIPIKALSMTLFLILGFIPMLLDEMNHIRKAQEVRGISLFNGGILTKFKFIISIIIPLLITIFQRSEKLSDAMIMRRYDPFSISSRFRVYKTTKIDILVAVIIFVVIIIILFI